MTSKVSRFLQATLSVADRLLWEKYNKPNRNLFQALSAFEANGIGRKVVSSKFVQKDLLADADPLGRERSQKLLLHSDGHETKGEWYVGCR
jgi:hypothetical protein